jgi:putative transposase
VKQKVTTTTSQLCRLFGVSRQSFYQYWKNQVLQSNEQQIVLDLVRQIRKDHPVIGTRKLYLMIKQELESHHIKMGRDKLYDLLAETGLLLRKRRRRVRTTYSNHRFRKYPNLIVGLTLSRPNQVWVSDITYWRIKNKFWYISLITDAYSKKVVGYKVATNLKVIHTMDALKKAVQKVNSPIGELIHHSDRGFQYCAYEYTDLLKAKGISISMTQNGDPLENPIAERINGILKQEYLNHFPVNNIDQAEILLEQIVNRYNSERPHMSCQLMVPDTIHHSKLSLLGKYNMSTYIRNKKYV